MCGIAGIYDTTGRPPDPDTLADMARAIGHRGPDGERFHTQAGVGLAHLALRIIDLSDAAVQPMTNEDESLWLIFNGEIYNYIELRPILEASGHRFHSHSDSETILHAYEEWGVECLHRFNGMFAFALWDSRGKQLFVARDRIGVKPLYYRWWDRKLVFGSEIKALLAHPDVSASPNFSAIAEYMNAMYTTGEHTWFEGIKRLLPGHYLVVNEDGLQVRQWWDLPREEDALGERPERYYIQRTREILEDSVRLRLRSDVPLGAHLSGGLGSSAVVALYSRQLAPTGEPVRTFSGAFAEGSAYDERPFVRDVVKRYHTDHYETIPTSGDLRELLDRMVWHMDEPTAGPGLLLQFKVCELTRRSGVIVINGGQGGDEEWGGYFGYLPSYLRLLARQARSNPILLGELFKDGAILLGRSETRTALIGALSTGRRGRLEASDSLGPWAGPEFRVRNGNRKTQNQDEHSAFRRAMYLDMKWYLPALLHVEDRTSMAFGLESRAPLLDYRLVEHAARVPGALKLKNLEMKHIFREAVKDLLPPSVYRRTDKKGMPTPISIWFRGGLDGWVRSELEAAELRASGLLDPGYVRQALDEHVAGSRDRSLDLWKMLNLASWWRTFITGNGYHPETTAERAELEPVKTS